MKQSAGLWNIAIVSASLWLASLIRRPLELSIYHPSDIPNFSMLAVSVGCLAGGAAWAAARRGVGLAAVNTFGCSGLLTVLGAARRPNLPSWVVVVVDAAWLCSVVAVAAAVILCSPRCAALRRHEARLLLGVVAVTGVAAAVLAGGAGFGNTIGKLPSTDVSTVAKVALGIHTMALVNFACWALVRLMGSRATGLMAGSFLRDPVLLAASGWMVLAVTERAVHLLALRSFRDVYRDVYLPWASLGVVRLPLIASGAVIGVLGWSLLVRPRAERLPGGTLVLPDRDPVAMLREDLAAWVGDPTLQLAFADGAGGWITAAGRTHLEVPRYDRATTVVTRNGREVGILSYDVALSGAPDVIHTAAMLAGLAFDSNQLVALSEGRLAEMRRLGERLLAADTTMRNELEAQLDAGPVGRLRRCADELRFGSAIERIVEPIRLATAEVRLLSHGLYPPELIEGGLDAVVGDRRGAPRRRLPPAIEVTAFLLVSSDPQGWFDDRGTMLDVRVRRETIPSSVLDRIEILGGTVTATMVTIPIEVDDEMTSPER